ncbi:MAG: hypothetical protein ACE5FN_04720 [Leptospirillia bacterium]
MTPNPRHPIFSGMVMAALLAVLGGGFCPPHAVAIGDIEKIKNLSRETQEIRQNLEQAQDKLRQLVDREAQLAEQVKDLKRAAAGVVRDAQLQDALKNLHRVVTLRRNLDQVRKILATTLKTRQVSLTQAANRYARSLMEKGEAATHAGDHEAAMAHFTEAFGYLIMVTPEDPAKAGKTRPLLPSRPEMTFSGNETPDELRVAAQIVRDISDRVRWNGTAQAGELVRLQTERDTLETLISAGISGTLVSMAQEKLDARIAYVSAEVTRLRGLLAAYLHQAAGLEARADREETELLSMGETTR